MSYVFLFSKFSLLKLSDYVILLIHIYSLAGNDVFYGKEEKDRTHVRHYFVKLFD